jgi:hypothetical protein
MLLLEGNGGWNIKQPLGVNLLPVQLLPYYYAGKVTSDLVSNGA